MILKYNNRVVTHNDRWINYTNKLPPYTIRLLFEDGVTPTFSKGTGVQVSSSPNIWDLTYNNSNWDSLLYEQTNLLEVLGANSTGVTDMGGMFLQCNNLTSVALFDTSNVTYIGYMFSNCYKLISVPMFDTSNVTNMETMFWRCDNISSIPSFNTSNVTEMRDMFGGCFNLESVPLFDTSKVTNINGMFQSCFKLKYVPLFNTSSVTSAVNTLNDCRNVESGALALYNQMSSQTTPPTYYSNCFKDCGRNTTTGYAELQQIPQSWGGLA